MLELAAQLHDIGKIGIPDAILHNPAKLDDDDRSTINTHCVIDKQIIEPLTPHEWAILKSHTRVRLELQQVSSSPLSMLAYRIVYTHHERFDGTSDSLGRRARTSRLKAA